MREEEGAGIEGGKEGEKRKGEDKRRKERRGINEEEKGGRGGEGEMRKGRQKGREGRKGVEVGGKGGGDRGGRREAVHSLNF